MADSTNAVFLGPGLYDDGQLLLEVIQDGEAASLLSGPVGAQAPVRDVAHR